MTCPSPPLQSSWWSWWWTLSSWSSSSRGAVALVGLVAGAVSAAGAAATLRRAARHLRASTVTRSDSEEDLLLARQVAALSAREEWAFARSEASLRRVVPVTLVAGPLGSGKTTLTRRIVASSRDFSLGVIVNDFAQLNVDAERISDEVEAQRRELPAGHKSLPRVMELSGGCVCCSLSQGLAAAVRAMLAHGSGGVDYVVVETSGLTDPVEMVRVIEHELGRSSVRLDAVVFVLDADRWQHVVASEARALSHADVVLLNKVDLLREEEGELTAALAALRRVSAATVLPTSFCDTPLERVLDVVRLEPEREAFGRKPQGRGERAALGAYALPEHGGGNLVRRLPIAPGPAAVPHLAATGMVFSAHTPWTLPALQRFLMGDRELRTALARVKGDVMFQECPEVRFSLELSGRSRLDLVPQGRARATTATPVKLALVLLGGASRQDEVRSALQACSGEGGGESSGSGSSGESSTRSSAQLRSWLRANENLEVWPQQLHPHSGTIALRLTGARSYGAEENLRLKYAVHLDAANETLYKCINSFGNGVVALPLWLPRKVAHGEDEAVRDGEDEAVRDGEDEAVRDGEDEAVRDGEGEAVLAVAISECVQLASAIEAIEFAIKTTFKVNFSHVSLCGCE